MVSGARLMLTCGLPGAGKTALAMQLAADRSALRVTKDEWLMALGSNPWDEPTHVKLEHELWHLAQEVLRLGLSVVLDFGLWTRSERDEFRAAARGLGVGVELHYLDVPTDELWRRIQHGTQNPPGTATRLAAPTSTSGRALPSTRCCRAGLVRSPTTIGMTHARRTT